jgi:hypothetical protein
MGVLTYRAERALLGAMLGDRRLVSMLDYIETDDFAWDKHRKLHDVLAAAAGTGAVSAADWRQVVELAADPDIEAGYLDELQAACPDPLHGPDYAAMVVEASVRRMLARHADELAAEAESVGRDARRLITAAGALGHQADTEARHMARVAAAIRVHSAQFSPDTSTGKAAEGESAPAAGQAWSEERVLGALIQQHPETGQVLAMLPATVFTSPLRREIFEVIRSLHVGKRPVDALTVDWELARRQAASGIRDEAPAGPDESYAARLVRLNTGNGPVIGTAHALLTAYAKAGNSSQPATRDPAVPLRSTPGPMPLAGPGPGHTQSRNSRPDLLEPPPGRPGPGPGREQRI